jgi:hypothetical protein
MRNFVPELQLQTPINMKSMRHAEESSAAIRDKLLILKGNPLIPPTVSLLQNDAGSGLVGGIERS